MVLQAKKKKIGLLVSGCFPIPKTKMSKKGSGRRMGQRSSFLGFLADSTHFESERIRRKAVFHAFLRLLLRLG